MRYKPFCILTKNPIVVVRYCLADLTEIQNSVNYYWIVEYFCFIVPFFTLF